MQMLLNSLLLWARNHLATSSLLVALSVGCLVHWILNRPGKRSFPPGPWLNLPYVGYLPFLGTDFIGGFAKLQKKYGPIYRYVVRTTLVPS